MKKIIAALCCTTIVFASAGIHAQTLKAVDASQNAGKVEWVQRQINAGKVPFGEPVTREFTVKNISQENLIILQVRSNCFCTSTEWTQEAIPAGKTGTIKVTYDAQREGDFYRIVTVSTNFDPNQTVPLALVGKVEKQTEATAKQ